MHSRIACDMASPMIDDGCEETFAKHGGMARATGLEPAASGVTGRRSNQLSYARAMLHTGVRRRTLLIRDAAHGVKRMRNLTASAKGDRGWARALQS